jgi:Phytanoyl-CoA dioxygenase (PhyH)
VEYASAQPGTATAAACTDAEWTSAAGAPVSQSFRVSNDVMHHPERLRERLREDGYLFLKGCLSVESVLSVRADVLRALFDCGWLSTADCASPRAGFSSHIGRGDFWPGLEAVLRQPSLHHLTRDRGLAAVLARLFGEPFFCQPRRVPRLVYPSAVNELSETAAHQDCPYVQGTLDTLTTWIPLGDVSRDDGSLEVMQGSHHDGIRQIFGGGLYRCAATAVEVASVRWRGGDLECGDVLIFTCLTVHRARPNNSSMVRLSMDCRFQPTASSVCSAVLEPAFFPHVADWPDLLPPEARSAYRVPDDTRVVAFVAPEEYVPPTSGRVFPWLRSGSATGDDRAAREVAHGR